MEPRLLLSLANREVDPRLSTVFAMAVNQLGLLEAGVRLYERASIELSTRMTAASLGTDAHQISDILQTADAALQEQQVSGRSFVQELTVFKKLLLRIAAKVPAVAGTVAELDKVQPTLNGVRNTLAHLDERSARSESNPVLAAFSDGNADFAPLLKWGPTTFGARMADGSSGQVTISSGAVAQCRAILWQVVEFFPTKQGHDEALRNHDERVIAV